jgi:hypothetical protein
MLLVMVVFSVMAAAGSYLMRSVREGTRSAQLTFLLFTLAAPVLLVVIVSVLRELAVRLRRRP